MRWEKQIDTIFSEAVKMLANWQYLPENTRVIVRDGKEIYMWVLKENLVQEIIGALAVTPEMRVEFWNLVT